MIGYGLVCGSEIYIFNFMMINIKIAICISLTAQDIILDGATDEYRYKRTHEEKQSGLSIGLENPILSVAENRGAPSVPRRIGTTRPCRRAIPVNS